MHRQTVICDSRPAQFGRLYEKAAIAEQSRAEQSKQQSDVSVKVDGRRGTKE